MSVLHLPFLTELVAIRHDIHAHPELAFKEARTADIVARELTRYGLEVHSGIAGTGVVGVLRKGSGRRSIGLRADMDALPVLEKNETPYRSRIPGHMHACGHDGHTTMLLGAARYLAENIERIDFDGVVNFIFQPAEESEAGALVMVEDGLFEKFPMDAVFGMHNWPGVPAGEMVLLPGPVMAGTCAFEIKVRGHGSHAAMPHEGVDSILAGAQLVQSLQSIVSRNVHPCSSAVVSITQFHAGEAWNVLPDEAILRGTLRSFTPQVQADVEAAVERVVAGVAATFGAQISVTFDLRYPPTINSVAETALCHRAAVAVLGETAVRNDEMPSMGAEDFAYMLREKPGCYAWLGNGPGVAGCTLHNPHYDFNDAILPLGVSYWISLVKTALAVDH
ncbi:M20 aminoacylase family protein [Rhodocyclus gracilis]|uniref:Amidohydrolase n=1 Tax=Rhodocyclus tenuis TaxID=1066 RepID=A0A6L5JW78_RHOTE|nr:M20 aminoacylase family protein [Rhodocyclus gracilis]MQY51326.1 amidohydrolase [Rhodocyclus gracilis]